MLVPGESTRSLVYRYQRGIIFFPLMPVVRKYMKEGQKFTVVIFHLEISFEKKTNMKYPTNRVEQQKINRVAAGRPPPG